MAFDSPEEYKRALVEVSKCSLRSSFPRVDDASDEQDTETTAPRTKIITAVMSIVSEIYDKKSNIRVDSSDMYEVFNGTTWIKMSDKQVHRVVYGLVHALFRTITRPLSYYMTAANPSEALKRDDHYALMKHLDAFVNTDNGYGWGDKQTTSLFDMNNALKDYFTGHMPPEQAGSDASASSDL
jgi:hypothetical protein